MLEAHDIGARRDQLECDAIALDRDVQSAVTVLMGIEPTGKTFKCRMTAFFIFEGPDLVCERVYFDSATILRQLTAS